MKARLNLRYIQSDLLKLISLCCVALLIGYAINLLRADALPQNYQPPAKRIQILTANQQDSERASPATRQIRIISLAELQNAMAKNEVVIFDVRSEIFYAIGHIPGSKLLPQKNVSQSIKSKRELLDLSQQQAKKIALYCAGRHCPDASTVSLELQKLGYDNLYIFEDGWEVWKQAGLPQESAY